MWYPNSKVSSSKTGRLNSLEWQRTVWQLKMWCLFSTLLAVCPFLLIKLRLTKESSRREMPSLKRTKSWSSRKRLRSQYLSWTSSTLRWSEMAMATRPRTGSCWDVPSSSTSISVSTLLMTRSLSRSKMSSWEPQTISASPYQAAQWAILWSPKSIAPWQTFIGKDAKMLVSQMHQIQALWSLKTLAQDAAPSDWSIISKRLNCRLQ